MSRSYKKAIYTDDGKKRKFFKRLASKRVRHNDVGNFGEYKKHYDSYTISDYAFDERWNADDSFVSMQKGAKKTRRGWRIPK